jgi:uncharacterized membrane protein
MLRERLVSSEVGTETNFRWRGGEITRIEGFSDAVFAFAVTLLVVSLEVPQTFDQLLEAMRGFIAFAICFLMLVTLWNWHYRFFRRYGLQDNFTILLNAVVLFLMLFFVYPLKFLFTMLVDQLMGQSDSVTLPNGTVALRIKTEQAPLLMTIYGLGFMAMALIFAVMYGYAYRQREELDLNPLETILTVESIRRYILLGSVALVSVLIAVIGGPDATKYAGYAYFLIWPVMTIHGRWSVRKRRAIARLGPAKETQA